MHSFKRRASAEAGSNRSLKTRLRPSASSGSADSINLDQGLDRKDEDDDKNKEQSYFNLDIDYIQTGTTTAIGGRSVEDDIIWAMQSHGRDLQYQSLQPEIVVSLPSYS